MKKRRSDIPQGQWILFPLERSPLSLLPLDAVDFDDVCWNITEAHVMVDGLFLLPSQ
jgi:hypothetical protein